MSSKYSEAERRMLELKLGGTVVVHHQGGVFTDGSNDYLQHFGEFGPSTIFKTLCIYDSAEAFALMAEHSIDIDWAIDAGAVRTFINIKSMYHRHEETIANHASKEVATRFAIVQAVIAKLESGMDAA